MNYFQFAFEIEAKSVENIRRQHFCPWASWNSVTPASNIIYLQQIYWLKYTIVYMWVYKINRLEMKWKLACLFTDKIIDSHTFHESSRNTHSGWVAHIFKIMETKYTELYDRHIIRWLQVVQIRNTSSEMNYMVVKLIT